ncbi:MAG: flagellar basal-body rod protein FlgB [Candidatus Endobugula sp.]|jgi:flagellar basal-body rod protein FlgB
MVVASVYYRKNDKLTKIIGSVMAINFSSALGVHEQALRLRSDRAALIADNLANADTPGYKAKDIDFKAVLGGQVQMNATGSKMQATHAQHFAITNGGGSYGEEYDMLYRTPQQPSIDGNTVEEQIENAEYMKNSLAFEASFNFLDGKFKKLASAIKGE